jgi:hypothetical protein
LVPEDAVMAEKSLDAVVALERELLTPPVRRSRQRLEQLLDPSSPRSEPLVGSGAGLT